MVIYAPGTEETDPKKQNIAIQQAAAAATVNATSIAALQAGAVIGPASATDNGFAVYNGTTGKLVKNHAATIALGSEVSGNLPVANLNGGTAASASTFWRGDGAWASPATSFSPITASLGADVALNNTANYFDGPSIAQGTVGTWFVSGYVTVSDTASVEKFWAKLWDGTTVIASGAANVEAAGHFAVIALSGFFASPSGNFRISVRDPGTTTGQIVFNQSGNSKDSTITAIRIA